MKKLFVNAWSVVIVLAAAAGCKVSSGLSSSTMPGSGSDHSEHASSSGAPAPSCATPHDHCLEPDDVLVSDPFESAYVDAWVGKQTAPPNSAGEATYMILSDGSTRTSRTAYRSRRAAPNEIAVGALVAVLNASENDIYRAPQDRQQAMGTPWFVARVVSLDPLPEHVVVSGGYKAAPDAIRIIDGDDGPRLTVPGAEDASFIKPEHWLVGTDPLPNDSYITVRLAFAVQPPSPQTRDEGDFFITGSGERLWTKHAWKTRPATEADIKLGAHVAVFDGSSDNVYRGPSSRIEALAGTYFIAKVTDTSELFKGVVTVAGNYRAQLSGLRVLVR